MVIKKVGLVGCGQMGSGISLVCAQAGLQVKVTDISDKLAKRGINSIDSYLSKSIEKGKLSQRDKDVTMARIKGTTSMHDLADCDFIVEAVPEKLDLKKAIFTELVKVVPKHVVLATNASVLSIIDIAVLLRRSRCPSTPW